MKKILAAILVALIILPFSKADEGMWIPLLLDKYNIEDMQQKGFKLTAEDIYSINKTSLKDAIVIFGSGCTAELISDEGLILTNHHCGFGLIQSHSSVENDYLTNGFWAMTKEEELSNPGLEVRFLVKMEDVTNEVLENVNIDLQEGERQIIIEERILKIQEREGENNNFEIIVKAFFYGNQYFLIVYEVFKDIRLVGAPPSSIGKFGGDTDNWMWPRHTGDFSLFRIYAGAENKPAKFSEENVPYNPKYHLPISLKGIEKNDFTMVYGYPGRTSEYLTSYAVKLITEVENPHQIKLRKHRLDIMGADMENDPAIRIKYASKHARVANYWKKWIGENRGLKKLNAIEKKQSLEKEFTDWVNSTDELKSKYGNLLTEFEKIFTDIEPYTLAVDYLYEAIYAIEIVKFASKFKAFEKYYNEQLSDEDLLNKIKSFKSSANSFYKDYNQATDKKCFVVLLNLYNSNIGKEFIPEEYSTLLEKKFKGNISKYADYIYEKSMFADQVKLGAFLNNYSHSAIKKLQKDPAYKLFKYFMVLSNELIYPKYYEMRDKIASLNRLYMQGLQEMKKEKVFYPDANFTLRLTYGKVDDYSPADAVHYNYFTTLKGIIEKDNPDIYDYKVPEKLKNLYQMKDYGIYSKDSIMEVCFTASNHTTGGNSGSPVLNAEGHLIGLNFDRNWEGTMSDIMYDPAQCRNIALDIRYTLFIIDKFAGAGHLIEEMTLIE